MKTSQYIVPVEVMPEVALLLHQNNIRAELKGIGKREGTIIIEIRYDPERADSEAVIDNLDYFIRDFNHYRFGANSFEDYLKELD